VIPEEYRGTSISILYDRYISQGKKEKGGKSSVVCKGTKRNSKGNQRKTRKWKNEREIS
jgi:hypothetical protein